MSEPPAPGIVATLRDAFRTPAGIAGGAMLLILLSMSIIVPLSVPYNVVESWTDSRAWQDNPRTAAPEWADLFTEGTSPRSTILERDDFRKTTLVSQPPFNVTFVVLRETFTFAYDDFPSEMTLWVWAKFGSQSPFVTVQVRRPDNETVELLTTIPDVRDPVAETYFLSNTALEENSEGIRRMREWARLTFNATDVDNVKPEVTLFAIGGEDMLDPHRARVLRGEYTIIVAASAFLPEDDIDAKFIAYGKVFGWAGTDTQRRDILTGLMWGAPVALLFGVVAGVVIILVQAFLGVVSAWYGGRVDTIIQRASDFFLILPILPILILIGLFYRPTIWLILLILIAFGFIGGSTKVIRSIVLQVKEEQFVESALSYGASRMRILLRHLFPRVLPYTFALIALNVPGYIFLEASLAFLNVGDPTIPTWGSFLGQAYAENALPNGFWWWVALPAAGIIFTTIAFALLGYSFDKVLNPRLREQ